VIGYNDVRITDIADAALKVNRKDQRSGFPASLKLRRGKPGTPLLSERRRRGSGKDEGPRMKDEIQLHDGTNQPPTLEYARAGGRGQPPLRWWIAFVAILLAFLAPRCACGYYGLISLPFTVLAAGLACYGWIGNKRKNLIWRAVLMLVVILTSITLFRNIADVLWFGHDAIWRRL